MIDNKDIHRSLLRYQLESKLFLQGLKERWSRIFRLGTGRLGSIGRK